MALHLIEVGILHKALKQLDEESYQLIYALYFAKERATEKKLADAMAVSQNANSLPRLLLAGWGPLGTFSHGRL